MRGCEPAPRRVAAITLDVEEWYHLDYLRARVSSRTPSVLDGVSSFLDVMDEMRTPATLFALGELARPAGRTLRRAAASGHSIACHGWEHTRPMLMTVEAVREDASRAKAEIEDVVGVAVEGYRAPCFSFDRARLDAIRSAGFKYDSSKIDFPGHPLYGRLDLSRFSEIAGGLWLHGDFVEFEAPTAVVMGRRVPVSGGGYLRLFPWAVTKQLLKQVVGARSFYLLYIHPFELSDLPTPFSWHAAGWRQAARYAIGRKGAREKLKRLILHLKAEGYTFLTLPAVRTQVLTGAPGVKA